MSPSTERPTLFDVDLPVVGSPVEFWTDAVARSLRADSATAWRIWTLVDGRWLAGHRFSLVAGVYRIRGADPMEPGKADWREVAAVLLEGRPIA